MAEKTTNVIPERKDVPVEHTWNLEKLFSDDASWEKGLEELAAFVKKIPSFKGTLGKSAANLRKCFDFMNEILR